MSSGFVARTTRGFNLRGISTFGLLVVLPVAVGALIYVGWRSPTLLVFDWMTFCGIPLNAFRPSATLPHPILYSLPDGCWVLAGTSWMLLIWRRLHPWVFVFAVLGIGGEFGQAVHLVSGTFDWNDVAFCAGGCVLSLLGCTYVETLSIDNRPVDHGRACCG